MKITRRRVVLAVALAVCLAVFGVCATQGLPSSLCPRYAYSDQQNPAWYVPPSLDEQIVSSAVIARASLLSVSAATERRGMADFRAVQRLRFTIHEYLKGSGPSELLVEVEDDEMYCWRPDAHEFAERSVESRNTSWDSRQAIIFLDGAMTFTHTSLHVSRLDYTIDELNRSWLPESDTYGGRAQAVGDDDMEFMSGGTEPWPPLITLGELKAEIAAWDATMRAGEGIEGYELCIERKLDRERINRATRRPFEPPRYESELNSGAAAGVETFRHRFPSLSRPGYNNYWLSGPGAAHFQAGVDDADSNPTNGYHYTLSTDRPLPTGVYSIRLNEQSFNKIPCNFRPDDAYDVVTVTVNAPAGTLHEAFFDPVYATSTGEYKADASHGALGPTRYRAEGDTATTTIHAISWKAGQVSVTLWPYALPVDHHLDFIALDGSVTLRLDVDDAASGVSGGYRVMSWRVCEQPWQAGDKLMLRIAASDGELRGATRDGECG